MCGGGIRLVLGLWQWRFQFIRRGDGVDKGMDVDEARGTQGVS